MYTISQFLYVSVYLYMKMSENYGLNFNYATFMEKINEFSVAYVLERVPFYNMVPSFYHLPKASPTSVGI